MADRYPHVMKYAAETPWAIRPEKLIAIREMLALRAAGMRFSPEEIQARIGSTPDRQTASAPSVAVIPMYGTIMPRASSFDDVSGGGGTSVQGLSAALRSAVADDSIDAILLDIDSPGGSTDLIPEFAAEIRDARGSKPIVAIANTDMASAAYWLGSQADELVVTPSGLVGSIGVFAAHQDISAAAEMEGVKTTLISAGKFKVESNPFEALSDEARAAIQARVDDFYGMFLADVAAGRGVSAGSVRGGFGEGRVVTAQAAVKAGMADRVDTFEATVERLMAQAASPSGRALRASGEPPGQWAEGPPADPDKSYYKPIIEAPHRGLSFAQAAIAVRDAADRLTADAGSLRGLTVAKRDVLSAVAESLTGSGAALAELLADTDPARPDPAVERAYLSHMRSKHA